MSTCPRVSVVILPAELQAVTQHTPSGHSMTWEKMGKKLHALVSAPTVYVYPQ